MLASFDRQIFGRRKVSLNSIDARIVFQKMVLIAQKLGLNMGDYEYGWYVHGPYSADLTVDAYKLASSSVRNVPPYEFTTEERAKIERIKQALKQEIEAMDGSKFELYGSIVFCMQNGIKDIAGEIQKRKPWYTKEQIEAGIKKMNDLFRSEQVYNGTSSILFR